MGGLIMERQKLTWPRFVRLADKYGVMILRWALALVGIGFATAPYLYMILQSLAPWREVNRRLIPSSLTTRSYEWLLQGSATAVARPWLRGFGNSVLVTSLSTLCMLVVAMLAGYALARLRFRGREGIYKFILFQMFYPAIILLVPQFLIVRYLGLYNTYAGMIIPRAVNIWAIFMYVSFFKSVNPAMLEAARIDGASETQVLFRIVIPLSRSITAVIGLFLFMERWVELLWDLIVVQEYPMMTLNVMIATMSGPYASYPGPLYAASVILTVPIILIFLVFSKHFTQGFKFILK
jgi:multiple sugar transport system permease protein